ncbi:transcriptional regulator [Haloarcula sp. CBA1130]|uniref:helix-turn-helix domain-containing protein n=1 Tax=unclassified Haloarcula TaxID=2624677 RepID=UPI0012467AEA|nr:MULTISPECIES: helix-turn-helix domain-containing protein [unclassified Haloarcula]KAA9397148.1 transcriptional regulator [Haloarcula sp. CBA1129]KAA9402815.1 transcriptional regulator [Haloarcula sp. CBA1130]
MSQTDSAGARLTLDLWHPNCWAIEATDRTDGGILAHTVQQTVQSPTASVNGVFTAYGPTKSAVEDCLDAVRASSHAGEIQELQARIGHKREAPGTVVRQFLLEYDPDELVCPTLLQHGFVHSAPVRIEDGRERWQVSFTRERPEIQSALDAVEADADADVSVESIVTPVSDSERSVGGLRTDSLTPAQRQAFEAAREAGYYQWPRGISVRELADQMDISKTTLLEHLRTAESKLLDPE